MRARLPSLLVVVALSAAGTLFVLGKPKAPAGPTAELRAVAADVAASLGETRAALHARASTLSELPRLAIAVATDAATVQNLTQEELAFHVQADRHETIEIGQITKTGKAVSLLRQPSGSRAAPPLDRPGSSLAVGPGGLMLSEVVTIVPRVQTDVERGVLAVSWWLDARPFAARLAALGTPGRLEFDGKVVAATREPIPAGAPTVAAPVPGDLAPGARIVARAPAPPGALTPVRWGAIAIGALGPMAAALLLLRRPARATAAAAAVGSPAPARAQGGRFGRYTLVRKLGVGGMAEVYLARVSGEAGFEKDVALKIMHRNLAQIPDVVAHFLDEARIASRLVHPNIVQIIDLGRAGDDYFIAMEYVDGYDLEYLLGNLQERGESVPPPVALAIARKVCDGLQAAHTAVDAEGRPLELVHRDVKAENVLLSRRGEVKVADFGIAKAKGRSRETQLGVVKGTVAYMAPEHRLGKPIDRRADVYGVGAILYEMVAGTSINLDLEGLAHLGREGWPHLTPLSQLRPEVIPDIDAIVFKALAWDREQRFPTCAALEEALEQVADGRGLAVSDKALAHWVQGQIAQLEGRAVEA